MNRDISRRKKDAKNERERKHRYDLNENLKLLQSMIGYNNKNICKKEIITETINYIEELKYFKEISEAENEGLRNHKKILDSEIEELRNSKETSEAVINIYEKLLCHICDETNKESREETIYKILELIRNRLIKEINELKKLKKQIVSNE